MSNTKEHVLRIVKSALSVAEDNLYRANMTFGHMSEAALNTEYKQSDRVCGEILNDFREEKAQLDRCVEWVKSR